MRTSSWTLIAGGLTAVKAQLPSRTVEVKVENGRVAGFRPTGGVATFLGIPYAQPPVGQLRFRPPEPALDWAPKTLEAKTLKPDCMQSKIGNDDLGRRQSEDCLFLNVWTPNPNKGRDLAVMVWIHGGAWQIGGSSRVEYNGAKLAANGVVVVNFNYRLGAFGFLAIKRMNLNGNFGLMDQRVVFHWVQKNIKAFGGDPRKVTLFGESAGAKSIGLHLLMPGAGDHLFHKAIMQSNPYGYRYRTTSVANFIGEALASALDCERGSVRCLQLATAKEILEIQDSLFGVPRTVGDFFTWAPVVTEKNRELFLEHLPFGLGHRSLELNPRRLLSAHRKGGPRRSRMGRANLLNATTATRTTAGEGNYEDHVDDDEVEVFGEEDGEYRLDRQQQQQQQQQHGFRYQDRSRRRLRDDGGVEPSSSTPWNVTVLQPLHEMERWKRGRNKVPVVVGTNAHEGHLFVYTMFPVRVNKGMYWVFLGVLFTNNAPAVLKQYAMLAEEIIAEQQQQQRRQQQREREQSAGGEQARTSALADYRPVLSAILNDYMFRCPSWRAAQLLSETSSLGTPVYVYEFAHPTRTEGYPMCTGLTCHTSEVPYVFNQISSIWANYSATVSHRDESFWEGATELLFGSGGGKAVALDEASTSASTTATATSSSSSSSSSVDATTTTAAAAAAAARGDQETSSDKSQKNLTAVGIELVEEKGGSRVDRDHRHRRRSRLVAAVQGRVARSRGMVARSLSAVTASAVRRLLSMARRKHRQPAGADTGDTVAATVAAATTPAAAVGDAIALDESSGDGDLGGGRKSDGSGGRPEGKRPVKPKRVASKGQWGKGLEKRAALKASREKLAEHLVRQYGEQDARDRLSALTIWKDMQHGHIPSAAARKIYWRKLQQMLAVDSDAVVARVTAIRWASFAKSSDPNDDLWGSKQGALEWPIWFDDHQHSDNSNFERHGSGSGGGSMGGSRSSGSSGDGGGGDDTNNYREEGGGGGGFISEGVFIIPEEDHDTETDDSRHDDEWARHGSTARAGGGSGAGVAPNDEGAVKHSRGMQQTQQQQEKQRRRSVYTRWDGGPEYLEIGNPNLIRHVGRDCFCEFWDSLEYAH